MSNVGSAAVGLASEKRKNNLCRGSFSPFCGYFRAECMCEGEMEGWLGDEKRRRLIMKVSFRLPFRPPFPRPTHSKEP